MGCCAIFGESISTASGTRCYYMLLVTPGQVVVLHTGFPLHGAWEDKHRAIGFKPGVRHAKFPPEIQGT
ncbi:hypothetical protein ALC60_12172 [Trachymyrmex zeteki]|uniref:Uncharacterized protein n=1 Tax=Mycetomoellerius zeteki TaxID=64791 RepID=A0A151WLI0_9HYME|nr:hypothetical protein ALC60_12172 [Trachymyrmex zeteki]